MRQPIEWVRCASCLRRVKGQAMSARTVDEPSGLFPFKHKTPMKEWCPGFYDVALPLYQDVTPPQSSDA